MGRSYDTTAAVELETDEDAEASVGDPGEAEENGEGDEEAIAVVSGVALGGLEPSPYCRYA